MASSVLVNYSLSGLGATVSTIVKVNPYSDSAQVESTLVEVGRKVLASLIYLPVRSRKSL